MARKFYSMLLVVLFAFGAFSASAAYMDFKIDLSNGNLLTADEISAKNNVEFGVAVAPDGTLTRVDADDADAVVVLTGKFHDNQHGWSPLTATVAVNGAVTITVGNCQYGGSTNVKADGESVISFERTANCYDPNNVEVTTTTAQYKGGAATLTIECGGYTPYLAVEAVPTAAEKVLYSTRFTEWGEYETKAKTSVTTVPWQTNYSHEDIVFSVYNTQIGATNFNTGKFPDWDGGMLMAAKSTDPYVLISPLASVTKVHFRHGATGSNRGWKLEAKGDGDDDWVVLSSSVANPATGCDVDVEVNRTNCELRFTNLTSNQNAYLLELEISGMVDLSQTPVLESFKVNGLLYEAGEIFAEDENGNMIATIEVSKTEPMISATNPITDVVAANGEIGEVTYEANGGTTIVTIPVTANGLTINYVATFIPKPDFTLTYVDTDGSELGTQIVEKDAAIAAFAKSEADVTVAEGSKFRGWFAAPKQGTRKYTIDDVVTSDLSLYALATPIETASTTERYDYVLNNQYFYAEDHEAFMPTGGAYHDGQHGWEFKNGKIDLLVGGKAYIMPYVCKYTNSSATFTLKDAAGNALATAPAYNSTDGKASIIEYNGPAGTVTLTCNTNFYLHKLSIVNVEEAPMERNEQGYYIVEAGNAKSLCTAIDMANATSSADSRTYIYVPDGLYDLGDATLTNISGDNISLIGQSMDGTIIANKPEVEGIGVTATIYNTGANTYIQDITLRNDYPYYEGGVAGRAVCLQDKGTNTICKNVRMLSYQDTYYSNNASKFYWETSDIHGTVDFICGDGDVYFNECLLTVEPRNADGSGECTITAPQTSTQTGYVFNNCTVDSRAAKFNFGRAWGNSPRCAYLNTTLLQPERLNPARWTAAGMNVAADRFVEYNTLDADGNVISPASWTMTFTKDANSNTMETILTADEAEEFALENVFAAWRPDLLAAQTAVTTISVDGTTMTWPTVDDAAAYALFCDGELVAFVTEPAYTADKLEGTWTIRTANKMGGLGAAVVVPGTTSIAGSLDAPEIIGSTFFNTMGQRVDSSFKGLVIRIDRMSDGSTTASKIVKR